MGGSSVTTVGKRGCGRDWPASPVAHGHGATVPIRAMDQLWRGNAWPSGRRIRQFGRKEGCPAGPRWL